MSKPNNLSQRVAELYGESTAPETPKKEKTNASLAQRVAELYGEQSAETPTKEEATKEQTYPLSPVGMELNAMESILKNPNMSEEEKRAAVGTIGKVNSPLGYDPMARANALAWDINNQKEVPTEDVAEKEGFDVERDFLGMSTKEMHEKPTDAAYVMPSLLSKSGEFNVGRKATKKEIKAAGDDAYLKAYGDEWLDENEERRKAEKAATKKHYDAAPEKVENDIAIFAPQRAKEIVATLPRVGDMVVYNGTEYRPEEVEYALTKAIFNKMDAYALENNLNYFKHRFKQETGMAYDAYLKQVTPARLDAIEKRVRQLRHLAGDALERELWSSGKVNMGGRTFHSGGVTPASESIVKQIDSRRSKSDRMFNDILEEIEHMRSKSTVDNFITGWDKEFDFYKMLPLAELWETMDQYAIMKKAEEGKVLSAQERYVLEAMQLQQELEELKGQLPKASNFNRLVGEAAGIAGTSTTILPQFLVGMGTTSSIGKLASVSLKQGYKTALKNAGKNFAVGTARGAVAATYSPYTYSNYYKKAKDQYSFNEDGSIKFDEQSKATMFLEAYIESMNEFSSEWWGVGMAEIAGEGMKWFGRMTNLENTMPMANKLLTISPEKRALYRNMGFTGDPVSEWASEMSGDFMSEVEKSLFGKGDFSMFERPDYWYTTIMGTGMFSAGMLATNVPSTVKVYKDVKAMKKEQSKILENMDSKSFANEVKTIGAMTNVDQQSMALAKANKNTNISKTDKIAADKYIKIGEDIKVRLGVAEESIRQKKFLAELEKNPIPAHTNGKIMEVTSADGTVYNILDGDYKDRSESSMLKVKNKATGEVSSILASSLPEQEAKEYSVAKVVEKRYNDMFDVDIEAERIKDLQDTYNSLEDASEEDVARLMEQYGHAPLKVGDKVALVDGRSVEVDEVHKDGTYTMHDVASGDVMSVPFYSVQSVDVVTAEAQAKLLADKENARIEEHVAEVGLQEALAPTEEATAESKEAEKVEKATPKQKPTEVHEGDIIEHNGREAVVMEVYDDGTAVINYDTTGRMNDIDTVNVADIIGNGEETPAMAEDAKEEMNTIEDVEEIPTDENGNIDFDSITNPKTFAKEYAARLGKEKAKQSVRNMTKQTQHLIEKLREKIAKATNANETIALEEQKKTAEERYKFYEDVLNEMYGTKVGIVENEYSADLNDPIRKKVQAFAELLGVRIEFVDEVIGDKGEKANANIEGKDVKIAWAKRQKTISFLLGHELTHRMQDVSSELYEKVKASIRKVEGEEAWNDKVEGVIREYNKQNAFISREGAEDEAVADYVGDLVETRDAFDNFLKAQNEEDGNAVVRFFRNALRWMRNKLKKKDALKDVEKHLNALIADASKRIGDAPEIIEREPRLSARTNEEVAAELSALDAPYMEAVNNGDMVTAEKMVREAANAAGYTIEALHGTENAGFTTFDPARSQNGRTLFFTSTRKYAEAMAKGAYDNYDFGRRDIFTADKAKSFIEHFSNGDMRDLKVETYLTNDGGKTFVYQYNKMQKEANDPSYERVYEISQRRKPLVSRTEMMGDEGIVEYARNLDKQKPRLESSIYNVALRMENPLDIDLKGAPWNEIEFNGEVIDSWDLSEYAYENGYDGVIAHNQGVNNKWRGLAEAYHIFDPANVKSLNTVTYDDAGNVIPLSERFNPRKEDVRYSLSSLVGVHNLSLDKLRKVIKMGGLANPSVAVIDVDKQTHVDYGEYSLILPKNMVDARQGKNAGTWAGDAWTPTYPQVVKRMNDDKAISRFYKDIDALPEAMRSRVRLDFDSFMDGRSANALAYWYLFEKGNAPEMVLVPSRYSNDVTNAVLEATKGSFSMFNLTPEERAKCLDAYIAVKFDGDRAAFEAEMQARIERLAETIETKKSDRVKKWAQDTIDSIKEYGFDYDDVADFIRDVGYDAREKGKVNVDATILAAQERINESNLAAEYVAWRNNLDERYGIDEFIFDGYTNSGNRRYLPHTVENASKWMKKQGRQGAVATYPSFGTFVAVSIPKMTTLESIRKRKALLGKSKEEYDAFREKWENVYYELGKKLQPDAKSFEDYGYWRLIEAVGQKNPKEFIKKEYGIELSEEDMTKFNDMVNAIRTEYPARYFETKFERPLQLSDFTAAVVPNDIPLDVGSRLKDAGVEVIEYEKGDNASRAEAMQKASAMKNVRFSLMDDAQAAAEVVPYLEAYNNDLTTFNALVNKVKDVSEKYPNATWPERFLKENYEDENEEDFINRLKWTISNYAIEEEKDYSEEKHTIEETFGGIWIEDAAEFAKFAKAVNNTPFEENGEGVAYTDNYFYAYYRSIDGQPIPFASVYMNKDDSQDIVNTILKAKRNGEKAGIRRYFDRAYERARHISGKNDGDLGTNKELSNPRRNDRMDSELSRYGAYYDSPELFVKSTRAYKGSRIKYSLQAPTFYSNAEFAVRSIKQEKATPEQWLKMIEKAGGLKAGEDKWLGLSDWLKASDKKTLTKDEVLQYIVENDIQIEEVSYGEPEYVSENEIYESDAFSNLVASLTDYDEDDNPHINQEQYKELQNAAPDFLDGFSLDYWGEGLDIDNKMAAARYLGLLGVDNEINGTRLQYTTQGLTKKKEIALVVPTIEPWNTSDNIHFGDAGEGRAVAWIRFGDAETPIQVPMSRRVEGFDAPFKTIGGQDFYAPENGQGKFSMDYVLYGRLKDGDSAYIVYINRKPISKHNTLEEARDAMNEYYKANPRMITRYDKVLVIDEIQSKRHQEGREKGYSNRSVSQQELYEAQEAAFSKVIDYESALADKYGEDEWAALATTEEMAEYERLRALDEAATNAYENYDKGVPSAPFEKNWAELAMKRMLRYAAENGYDYVAWTTGDQQADRYDIGSVVKDIVTYDTKDADGNPIKKMKFRMNNMGTYNIATNMEGVIVKGDGEMKEGMRLSDITGKALAEKIMNGEGEDAMVFENGKDIEAKSLEGEELHIGNEGMKAFYDKMLSSFVKKYTKKWGAEVGEVTMPALEENNTMHAVNVTDSMRESVMQGQPKFSLIGEKGAAALDAYEEATRRLDDLAVARAMEREGKTAKAIKMATGWERGADNKWRYELEDFFGMFHMYGGLRGDMKIDNGELQDFLDHEELFAAYPDMRHTKVYIVDAEEIRGYRGLHHPIKDAIYLARRQHDDMARTLFHEVQHAIQEREGFAKGAAPDAPHPILSKARQKRIAELKDLYAIMEARYNESKAKTEEWRKKRLEVYQARDKYPNEASWQAEFDFYDRTWNRHDNADRKAKRALEASKEEIENLKKNMPKLGAEGYRRVAGEIEARSTGARVGLNWRERLQSLARDMEGIAPKDQIFIEKAVTNGMAEEARLSIRTDNADAEEMYRAALLEEAALMEREAMENGEDNAQEIADRTGWVRLADGNWEYYGAGRVALSDEDAALRAAFRWLEAKKAIKKARVRKMYDGLIKDQKKMVSEVEKEKTAAYSKLKRNADKVDYILQGQAIESLPIEDQILADIALGQRIKWSDGEGKHGLKSELGLGSAKDERMGAVTMAAKDYVEDYVERLMERNGGYEKGLNDNDIRSAVLEVFRSYPSPKQALEELYARYKPQAESTQASEALAQLEYERDAALAEIEAEYKETFEDFDANPDKYVREHQESEAYNADIDMYVGSLTKARKKVEQLERQMSNRKLSEEEKKFAVQAVKKAIAEELKDGLGRYTRKYDIQRMMDAVNEARTPYAMLKAMDKAMTSLYDIKYRKEQARMESLVKMKLTYGETTTDPSTLLNRWVKEGKLSESVARKIMNDYWKGVNASGVSVAKFVDNDTRQVMVYINKHATLPELREYKEGVDYAKVIQEKTTAMREALEQKQDITPRQREMLEKAIGLLEDMWSAQAMAAKIAADRHNVKAFEVKVRDLTTRLADVNKQMRDLDASGQKVVETKDGYKNADILRKELQNEYGSLLAERQRAFEEFYSEMPDVINKMQGANKTLEKLIRDGNIELRKERAAREEHRKKLINEALADLDRYDAVNRSAFEPQKEAFGERAFNSVVRLAGAPLGSMDYMLRRFGRNAPMGEGRMYQRFAPAIHEANGRIYTSMGECRQQLDAKAKELFGKEYSKVQRTAETTMVKGATIKYNEEKTKVVNKGKHNEMRVTEVIPRERTLLVTEAMYMLATWEQTDGRKTLLRMGVTEEDMIALRNALKAMNPQWVEFIDWIVRDFLPSRRPKYDKAHRALFGISMANVPNYFPIKRRKDSISKEDDIAKEEEAPLGSTVVGSIIERTSSVTDIEVNTSFFEALNENVMTLEAWVEMAPIIADVNTLMSSNAVKNAMNDVYADFAHDFREAAKVATLQYKSKRPLADQILSTILGKLWATSKIAFRFYTAFKQLSSAILFYGYSADPRFWAKLLKYYTCGMVTDNTSLLQRMVVKGAGFVGYNDAVNMNIWGNIQWACDNLPSFKKRWDQGYAGYDIMTRTIGGRPYNKMRWADWMDKGVDAFARWGFKANAYVDAFTSAAGARAVYEYEMERLMKDGYTEEEARAIATFKAEYSFNSTQQSAEGLYLSPMQADGSLASTVLSTFMNAGYAMYRNTVIAGRELSKVGDSWTKEREFIEKQEMKRFLKPLEAKVDAELKAKVDDINKQRSEGVITYEEANERIKEATEYAEATKREYFYHVKEAVQKRVKNKMRETKAKAALTLFLNGWLGQWAFNMMSQLPTLIMGIDDDDKEDYSWYFDLMMFAALPLSNMPLGGQVTQALYGNELEFIGSQGDLKRDWDSLTNNLEKEGYWEAAGIVGNMVLRYGLGVDLQSMFNIYAGVENMFEEGITVDNILMFMNAPSKQIRLIAGERREGETAQQYATRIMRLYSIFSSPEYNDYINTDEDGKVTVTGSPNRMTEKQVKWIQKNYDKEYLKDVTNKHYQGGYEAWTALEDEYKAAAKDVNTWDKIPTRMKNAKDQVNKRVKQRKTFVGTEENYYDILREQSEYMKSYIDKYNEYNEFK